MENFKISRHILIFFAKMPSDTIIGFCGYFREILRETIMLQRDLRFRFSARLAFLVAVVSAKINERCDEQSTENGKRCTSDCIEKFSGTVYINLVYQFFSFVYLQDRP